MNEHPVLLAYKDTLKKFSFPLILVVGREPNDKMIIGNSIGEYDWESAPHGFWATANEVIAEIVDMIPSIYKHECKKRKTSPVIISNAMPKCVEEGSGKQKMIRLNTTNTEIEKHISNLCTHNDHLKRVGCVWFCGLKEDIYTLSKELICNYLNRNDQKILYQELPFMRNTNRKKIRNELTDEIKTKVKEIFKNFKNET